MTVNPDPVPDVEVKRQPGKPYEVILRSPPGHSPARFLSIYGAFSDDILDPVGPITWVNMDARVADTASPTDRSVCLTFSREAVIEACRAVLEMLEAPQ